MNAFTGLGNYDYNLPKEERYARDVCSGQLDN